MFFRKTYLLLGIAALGFFLPEAAGHQRYFTYSYEPETMLAGALEFEQWITLRSQRTSKVGQDNFNRWDLREELEYGVTDRYTVGLYLNFRADSFRDPLSGVDESDFAFRGVSIENRYMVLNPAEYPIGLTLYLEPRFSGEELELEQKIIFGQRHGKWKWAVNLVHATEWEHHFDETVAEVEATAGLIYVANNNWAFGVEARNRNEIPEYDRWENTALYFGPVASYRQERWWATLTVLPQIFGVDFTAPDADGNRHLDLQANERLQVRLIVGIDF